ncbi:MAG TPA: hypothetical protein VE933_04165 [Chitinophagaceae bacterium]|nr:hypothetical protein [Chitinophagaceae bacterium]
MTTLKYNPQTLRYEIGFKDMPCDLRTYRNELIADLNRIQLALVKEPLDTKQFERFMRSTTDHLERQVLDQSALLNRVKYDQRSEDAE